MVLAARFWIAEINISLVRSATGLPILQLAAVLDYQISESSKLVVGNGWSATLCCLRNIHCLLHTAAVADDQTTGNRWPNDCFFRTHSVLLDYRTTSPSI